MGIEQLPFLLKLLDDESPVVRAEVEKALSGMAEELPAELARLEVDPAQRQAIHELLSQWRAGRLKARWPRAWEPSPDQAGLERAQELISEFFQDPSSPVRLGQELDRLAAEFSGPVTPERLAAFLFTQRLLGDSVDYYLPLNSSLLHVIERGRGNPISLCCVFILVGHRLGLPVVGCNFPGHFLANSEGRYFDCFRQGRELPGAQLSEDLARPCSAHDIMVRVLRNLVGAYQRLEQRTHTHLFGYLLSDLLTRHPGESPRAPWPEPTFPPGQLVRQRDSEYRGVVVHYALEPAQPRYYVLVHRASRVEIALQDQLLADDSGPVAHPHVNYFFSKFEGGCYYRNGRPWEG